MIPHMTLSDLDSKVQVEKMARLEPEIATTDAEINNLVYELYGITAEERTIIGGAGP